jgi:hypothetical protein
MVVIALASAFGDFFMRFSTMGALVYVPVWTSLAPQQARGRATAKKRQLRNLT